jgi:hypothetical protein
LQDAAMKHFARLTIGYAASLGISKDASPPDNPFEPRLHDNCLARKQWAINCLATARDWTFDYLREISRQLRQSIDEKFVQPLFTRKRWVERLEAFLYVASAVIALYEQAPAPGPKPAGPIRPPDMNDPRYRIPRPRKRHEPSQAPRC